jgi:hypothetical protein
MASVELTIEKPENGKILICPKQGGIPVQFHGAAKRPQTLAGVPIFYRWYSSLNQLQKDSAGDVSHYSLNETALTDPISVFTATLPMGSHAIVFAASDRSAEADIVHSQHGGVIGGVNKEGIGHVIHILKANILWPADTQNVVNVSPDAEFRAEAPWAWDDLKGYNKYNKLGYRWLFEPVPPVDNRPVLDFDSPSMAFHKATISSANNVLAFTPQLPANARGRYALTLEVRCLNAPQTAPIATDQRSLNLI